MNDTRHRNCTLLLFQHPPPQPDKSNKFPKDCWNIHFAKNEIKDELQLIYNTYLEKSHDMRMFFFQQTQLKL